MKIAPKKSSNGEFLMPIPIKKRSLPIFATIILTIWALIAHGYYFGGQDQRLYIPYILRTIDPSLYPNDYLFNQRSINASFFEILFIWPVHWIGTEWAMFLAYVLVQISILLSLFYLAKYLVPRPAAYLTMFLFILPIQVGGAEIRTYEAYLTPRTFVLPLTLLTLTMLWRRNIWSATLLACVHLLIHPTSALYTWLLTSMFLLWWFWQKSISKRTLIATSIFLLGTLSFMALRSSGNNAMLWLDPIWQSILEERTPFLFLSNWKLQEWLSLVTYSLLGIIGWTIRSRNPRTTALSIGVVGLVLSLTIIVFISADWLGFVPILQLQLARSWQLVVILAVIFGADLVYFLYQQQDWPSLLSATLLTVIIYSDQGRDIVWSLSILLLLGIILIIHLLIKNQFQDRPWVKHIVLVSYLITVAFTIVALFITQGSFSSIILTRWQTLATVVGSTFLIVGTLYTLKALLQQTYPKYRNLHLIISGGTSLLIAFFVLSQIWSGWKWFTNSINNLQLPFSETWRTKEYGAWQDVQIWAETNTPIDARFATSLNNEGFRIFSKRSPITEAKDGAPSLYTRAYAIEWQHRMQTVRLTETCLKESQQIECLETLYESYPFEYIVMPLQQARILSLELPIVYDNENFVVYSWNFE